MENTVVPGTIIITAFKSGRYAVVKRTSADPYIDSSIVDDGVKQYIDIFLHHNYDPGNYIGEYAVSDNVANWSWYKADMAITYDINNIQQPVYSRDEHVIDFTISLENR